MDKHLNILHIITRLDKGGSAENTLLSAIGQRTAGHSIRILCGVSDIPPSENEKCAKSLGVDIIRLTFMRRDINLFLDTRTFFNLLKHLIKNKYDIIHTHTSKAGFLGRAAAFLSCNHNIVHTPHGNVFHGYFSPAKTKFYIFLERICMRFTRVLIALTETEKQEHVEHGIGSNETIKVIASGIPLDLYLKSPLSKIDARKLLGLPVNGFIAGTVARLVLIKNHKLIVEAAKTVVPAAPDIRFVFVGDGPLRKELEKDISSAGLSKNFLLLDWRNDIPEILGAFDLFVLCSHNEGMGRVFAEAQARGVPVIGSRAGGIPDVINEQVTGFLVDPNDAAGLAAAILALYHERNKVADMAAKCKPWACTRFGADKMVEEIEKVYSMVLKND